jgi:hypothetical protein
MPPVPKWKLQLQASAINLTIDRVGKNHPSYDTLTSKRRRLEERLRRDEHADDEGQSDGDADSEPEAEPSAADSDSSEDEDEAVEFELVEEPNEGEQDRRGPAAVPAGSSASVRNRASYSSPVHHSPACQPHSAGQTNEDAKRELLTPVVASTSTLSNSVLMTSLTSSSFRDLKSSAVLRSAPSGSVGPDVRSPIVAVPRAESAPRDPAAVGAVGAGHDARRVPVRAPARAQERERLRADAARAPMSIVYLPERILSDVLELAIDLRQVSRSDVSLVCRAFRGALRGSMAYVPISLARLSLNDVRGVRDYAELVAKNSQIGLIVPAALIVPGSEVARPHPLASLLRDVRKPEFRDGATEALVHMLLMALALLKSTSQGLRFDPTDQSFGTGRRREPVCATSHALATGRNVAPLVSLSLVRCRLNDAGLVEIGRVAGSWLIALECFECRGIDGTAIHEWAERQPPPPLLLLRLDECADLRARNLDNFSKISTLRHIMLRYNRVTGGPLMIEEATRLQNLTTLALCGAQATSDRSLQVLYEARLTSLRRVDVTGATNVTFWGLRDLLQVPGLRQVDAMYVGPLTLEDIDDLQRLALDRNVNIRCAADPDIDVFDPQHDVDDDYFN